MASIISAGTTSGTSLNLSGDTSGVLQLASNGSTTALTISTAQVVTLANALPIASGGTGATSAGTALSNLGGLSGSSSQLVKAWVNFDGTLSSPITPRASFNVSSVTKNSTGDYTINFTTSFANTNYSICGTASANPTYFAQVLSPYPYSTQTTSAMRFRVFGSASTLSDVDLLSIAIFR